MPGTLAELPQGGWVVEWRTCAAFPSRRYRGVGDGQETVLPDAPNIFDKKHVWRRIQNRRKMFTGTASARCFPLHCTRLANISFVCDASQRAHLLPLWTQDRGSFESERCRPASRGGNKSANLVCWVQDGKLTDEDPLLTSNKCLLTWVPTGHSIHSFIFDEIPLFPNEFIRPEKKFSETRNKHQRKKRGCCHSCLNHNHFPTLVHHNHN